MNIPAPSSFPPSLSTPLVTKESFHPSLANSFIFDVMIASLDAMFWKLMPATLKKLRSFVSAKESILASPLFTSPCLLSFPSVRSVVKSAAFTSVFVSISLDRPSPPGTIDSTIVTTLNCGAACCANELRLSAIKLSVKYRFFISLRRILHSKRYSSRADSVIFKIRSANQRYTL